MLRLSASNRLSFYLFISCFSIMPVCAADRLPPAGIEIPDAARTELTGRAAAFRQAIDAAISELAEKPRLLSLMPDVEIFHKAVDWPLRYDEFFEKSQIDFAGHLLDEGEQRLAQLRSGKTPWLEATGLVVRGYRSKIDGSVQPYGLVIPKTYDHKSAGLTPLWLWFAGRNEKRTELAFLHERETSLGSFALSNAIVLHPYGRFCNATKFAGEIDVFEALNAARRDYGIDPNRIIEAGFSMGGASSWHIAVHHPGLWCGASPGAGFAETAEFARIAQDKEPTPWWELKLFRWYDATDWAGNLFNCPTIAYSGEIDAQKQSADIMEKAMAREGLQLERFIGPNTAHKYEPATRDKLEERLNQVVAKGRNPFPSEIHFTTYTLRYPEVDWLRIDRLEKHWERADVRAKLQGTDRAVLTTTNVAALHLDLPDVRHVMIDGQSFSAPRHKSVADVMFRKDRKGWQRSAEPDFVHKRPGLTGPIDDAFMDSFIFVRPTEVSPNSKVQSWVTNEMAHAQKMWRDIFRGDAPVVDDIRLSDAQIATNNLIVWGDPRSNRLIGNLLESLPLKWDVKTITFNHKTYDAGDHVPVLIFPNPLNQHHYIVLNSGIDFRNDAYGSNARQTPKLPDFAIIDLNTPPGPRRPGDVLDAGFFTEEWQLPGTPNAPKPKRGEDF